MARKFMPEDSLYIKGALEQLGWDEFTNTLIKALNRDPDTIQFITPTTITASNIQTAHNGRSAQYFLWGAMYAYALVARSETRRRRSPRQEKDDIDPLAAKKFTDDLVKRAQKTAREFGKKR
jgi:hypothetical protein